MQKPPGFKFSIYFILFILVYYVCRKIVGYTRNLET